MILVVLVPIWDWDLTWHIHTIHTSAEGEALASPEGPALPLLMLLLPLLQLLLSPTFRFFFFRDTRPNSAKPNMDARPIWVLGNASLLGMS